MTHPLVEQAFSEPWNDLVLSKPVKTTSSRGKRVLVVDDDEDQLEFFATILRRSKFEVVTAATGFEALRILHETPIHCMVCDVMMPGIAGEELIRMVRRSRKCATLPIVMVSATPADCEFSLLRLGADSYCRKRDAQRRLGSQVRFLLS